MVTVLLLVRAVAAACPSTGSGLDETLSLAEVAFSTLDGARLASRAAEAVSEAACLTDRPARPTIARLHRVEGLAAFVEHNDRAASAFDAARAIDPAYSFPDRLVPAGTPAATLYASATTSPGTTTPVSAPRDGLLEVDGQPATGRPTDRPALVLVVGVDGVVTASGYVWPDDPMPAYQPAEIGAAPASRAHPKGPNHALLAVAGASLLAAGGMYAANFAVHAAYFAASEDDPDREQMRATNNALVVTSIGIGALAVGTGIGAVVAGRW